MSVISHLATCLGRRDEVPNQELAHDLATKNDKEGICEIAENLSNKDKIIQADCIKVLYEISYIDPKLVAEYIDSFVKLLRSRNNRLAWGGMIALAEVARVNPDAVFKHLDEIKKANKTDFIQVLDKRIEDLSGSGLSRIRKVTKQAASL